MPRISVVVPIYNVERYLPTCLESVAAQTVTDLEVVMVDDGSTDGSAAIARRFADRDARFRLLSQANGGLSKARNTGIDAAAGEFLAFLDSDDALPRNAYELLLGVLEQTGSDFATGNVHRLTPWGSSQARFLAETFRLTRLGTHVTKFRPLLSDRTVWNKLWRRSFWDEHALRFPEGVVHEDIPVVLPAHFMARSVDVVSRPVYLYRMREDGELSITQRRLESRVLLDRLAAIEHVGGFLAQNGPRQARRWYLKSVVADDLRYHLNLLDRADPDYQALFLDRVNALLDTVDSDIFDPLPAIERLKWHLVRTRNLPELFEVLRFERDDLPRTPPVRVRRRWYGDYPFRDDPRLAIPPSVYRLDSELELIAEIEELWHDGDVLRIRGHAYIAGIGAQERGSQRLRLSALRAGPLRRLRLLLTATRLKTSIAHRPDVTAEARQALCDVSWSGFEATLDPRALRTRGRWRAGSWDLYAHARAGGVRRRARVVVETPTSFRAAEFPVSGDAIVKSAVRRIGRAAVEVRTEWLTVREHRHGPDDVLELSGDARIAAGGKLKLEVMRARDERVMTFPLAVDGDHFRARIPLAKVRAADAGESVPMDAGLVWALTAVQGARRVPVSLPAEVPTAAWAAGTDEVALFRNRQGNVGLVERPLSPLVTEAGWSDDGVLVLRGELPGGVSWQEVVLVDADSGNTHAFPIEPDGGPGRFRARLTPARMPSLAGDLPVRRGTWLLHGRAVGQPAMGPITLAPEVVGRLPLDRTIDGKPFALGTFRDSRAVLTVQWDLADDERGAYQQRHLVETGYLRRRGQPLRDAVVYVSYDGRQYSDSPRGVHEELVRRGADLEHLWVVSDGMCRPPETATVLRRGSRRYYEALAQSRYVIGNDHFPSWFVRRPEQVCVQTWHGTPLKRIGLDVSTMRKTARRFEERWDQQAANWQYVISPNRFSTPILQRAYDVQGEMLETGYPRVDVLARPDRDEFSRGLRRRLGVPDGMRVVLYAPTYRDQVRDRRGRYLLDLRLDLERLRAAVGEDTVILFRKHHYVIDSVPATGDGFVRDVSSYPDATELLLAADVLITDYSSMMVDFANTGRPMLFFTYDLDTYENEIRGFYLDFAAVAPGPLLRSTDEVIDALGDLAGVRAAYAERYATFRKTFCELDDGRAAARVVDHVFPC